MQLWSALADRELSSAEIWGLECSGTAEAAVFVFLYVCVERVQKRGQLELHCFTWPGSALEANYAVILQPEQVISPLSTICDSCTEELLRCEQFQ